MAIFKGAGVAIVTPFKGDFSVDYEKLTELIEFQIKEGTDAIIICGTTGEASTLTHDEHIAAIRHTVSVAKGRIPVVAGTGSNCTDTAIFLSKEAEKVGADALLIVTPYYNKATQKGLYEHYKAIAESVKLPIILYNVPSRTGMNILPETVVKLANDIPNIVAVKEACGNISQIAKLMSLANGKVDLYSGNDDQIVPIMALGGIGVISVLSNIAPKQTHDMCRRFLEGDLTGSTQMQLEAIALVDALFCEVSPIPVKKALELMKMGNGVLRRPLTEMEQANAEKLRKAMSDYGLL
ncbi:MAG: 4-hydroxy-tetrahydrodipicolinate synthase [Lachnospiraceae bacterium]|nr:4-hydroxy-tetrahydrodipicolinate synthase [Lachnospiraceae bacterium]